MFRAPADNKYGATFYGTAAISKKLGGGMWLAEGCGKCWKLTGTANVGNSRKTSVIVVKGANYCPPSNSLCNNRAHFDIAAPGFDWAGASQHNRCDSNQNEPALKSPQTCATWMIDSANPNENCNCDAIIDETLKNGCKNFKSLHWDNPDVSYESVDCPNELARMPCWKDNGFKYPKTQPKFCKKPM